MRRWIGAAVVAAGLLVSGCGGGASSKAHATPGPFTLSGSVTLVRGATDAPDGVSCTGWAGMGFGQVAEGAVVTVFGKDGAKVGEGALGLGKESNDLAVPYRFAFRVLNVPPGAGPYQVRVADQPLVSVSEVSARAGRFAASWG